MVKNIACLEMQDGCLWRTWQFKKLSCIIFFILICLFLSPSSFCSLFWLFLLTIFLFFSPHASFLFFTFVLQTPVSTLQNILLSSLGPAYDHPFISPLPSEDQSTNKKSHPNFSDPLFTLYLFPATSLKANCTPFITKKQCMTEALGERSTVTLFSPPFKVEEWWNHL